MKRKGNADVDKIYSALKESKYDFRTIRGIAKTTGISETTVADVLRKNPEIFRKSQVISKNGEETYALKENKVGAVEVLDILRSALTKGV